MSGSYRMLAVAVVAGVLAVPAVVAVQSDEEGRVPPGKEWPLVGGDWTNGRYSTLNQINTTTVKNLGGAWMSKRFDGAGVSRAAPVVKGGLMFLTAGTQVYALNAKTGETAWTWRSDVSNVTEDIEREALVEALNEGLALPSPRGVALGEGLVFVGLMDGRVVALRQETGELVWSQQIGDHPPKKGQAVSGAVTYARGVVFSGLANGDWVLRGKEVALDAKTGKKLWEFFTIPGPGEFGHDTWPKDSDLWKGGGAGVWHHGAIDADLGLVFFVTGNAIPMYGGEQRPGDNLFAASVVAVDMKTGKRRWHYQLVHHDVWEADVAIPPVLYDAQVGGQRRKALAAIRSDGYLFMLDRETGRPILPVEERPVKQNARMKTAATQPTPIGADRVLPDCNEWKAKVQIPAGFQLGCFFDGYYVDDPPNLLMPGYSMRVAPMSYSPQTGYFYAAGSASLGWRRRADDGYFLGPDGRVPGMRGYSVLAAIDSRTNKIAWKKEVPSESGRPSGQMTTAGGLLFQLVGDGNFEALDAKTGDRLWQFQTGVVAGRLAAAVTYEIDAEQYVAVPVGPAVWAFKLGGTLPPQAAPKLPSSEEAFTGLIENTNEIETTSLAQNRVRTGGHRYFIDEYAFNPYRARVKVGTRVTFVNNGKIAHTVTAQDGSWTTGRLSPAHEGYITFDKPGTHTYICKDHPWAYAQLIVVE